MLNVSWRSQTVDVPISGTISDMITASCSALSPLIDIETARIVFRSHSYTIIPPALAAKDSEVEANSVFTGSHPHALLFASAHGESAALVAAAADVNTRIRDDLGGGGGGGGANSIIRVPHALVRRRRRPLGTVPFPEPGFGMLKPLPNFDVTTGSEDRNALRFLRAVASHPGVIAVMRARSWHVETLAEMPATGKVSVDPVCVLGLNESNGGKTFRISLRLRTDDLSDNSGGGGGTRSFRKYATVMDTVWHELAHCAISEHSAAFYALVSVLKKEGEAADWRIGPQHVLGGERAGEVAWQANDDDTDEEEGGVLPPFSGLGEKLGGVEMLKESGGGMAERAAIAAETRILAAAAAAAATIAEAALVEVVVAPKILTPVVVTASIVPLSTTTRDITTTSDTTIDPLEPGRLRTERLRNDLTRVRADAIAAGVDSSLAITTLRNIVERAARGGDPRHLSIRKDNQILAQRTGGSIAAIHFLLGAGFITSIEDDGIAWLRVNDQAALWLAKAVAEEEFIVGGGGAV